MRLECTELRDVGEDRAIKALSSFSVKSNPDVENLIRSNTIRGYIADTGKNTSRLLVYAEIMYVKRIAKELIGVWL